MAFVAEDGTGLSNANSYTSVAFADDYFTDRGNTVWSAATTGQKQAALVRATDWVEKRFGRRFRGYKRSKTQSLEWPRLDAFDNDDFLLAGAEDNIPRQLLKAVCEYAVRALSATLGPDNANVGIDSIKEKVGPIETSSTRSSFQTAAGSSLISAASIPDYPEADLWVEELLKPAGSRRLVRG